MNRARPVPPRDVREFFIPDNPLEFGGPPVAPELDTFRNGGVPVHIFENGRIRRVGTVAAFDGRTFPPAALEWYGPKTPLILRREEFARRFRDMLR